MTGPNMKGRGIMGLGETGLAERRSLVIFSPLPPARNGIASYTAGLLDWLSETYDCVCVAADDAPVPELDDTRVRILYTSEYQRQADRFAGERHLYQVGNNAGHAYLLPWLERVPGIVTVHDASLAHLLAWLCPAGVGSTVFQALTEAAHGAAGIECLDALLDLRCGIGQELTYLGPVARASRAVVVHSYVAHMRVRAAAPGVPVHVIPCFAFLRPLQAEARPAAEASAGRPVRLLCLGFVTRSKRIDLVLAAMQLLRREGHDVRLTIAGEVRAEEYDVEADIAALGLGPYVDVLGYLDDAQMERTIADADILVNLRDPTSGESSGPLLRALGAGICSVVTDVGTFAELPDDAVIKVRRADMTPEGIATRLCRPLTDADTRARFAVRGRAHMEATASLESVSQCYVRVIEETYAGSPRLAYATRHPASRLVLAPSTAAEEVAAVARVSGATNHRHGLWWRERLVPYTDDEHAHLLVSGADADVRTLLAEAFGWKRTTVLSEAAGTLPSLGDRARLFDAALVLLSGDTVMPNDIEARLSAVASRLRRHAALTVEIVRSGQLPMQIVLHLAELGFELVRSALGPGSPSLDENDLHWREADTWGATFLRALDGHPCYGKEGER